MTRKAAILISGLFHPILVPFYGLLLIFRLNFFYLTRFSGEVQLKLLAVVLIITFALPVLLLSILKNAGVFETYMMDTKEERKVPYLLVSVSFIFNYYFLRSVDPVGMMNNFFLGTATAVVLALIINNFYKISIHAIGAGGILGLLIALTDQSSFPVQWLIPVWIIIGGLIGGCRIFLGAHTKSQVYFGYLLGFLATVKI